MQFYIDVEDSAGVNYGSGPVISGAYWRSTRRVDRSGNFEFAIPASDENASLIQKHRYVTCSVILNPGGPTEIGTGIIDKITTRPDSRGNVMLVVAGDDVMRELAWRSVEQMALFSGTSPVTHAAAVTSLAALFPAGWSATAAGSPGNNDVYYTFAGESCLAAAIKIAELCRVHVWMPTKRSLLFTTTWPSSGLRAIEAPIGAALDETNICYIESLEVSEDTFDLISRALPWGGTVIGGAAGALVNLANCTKAAPVGYTLSTASKYIKNDSVETTYGRIEAWMKFPDIKANSTAAADLTSAANMLFDAGLRELQKRSAPAQFFTLRLAHSPGIIAPMQTIRCVLRRSADGRVAINLDATLYIMGATTLVDAGGVRTTELDVATVDRWGDSDTAPVAKLVTDSLRIQ